MRRSNQANRKGFGRAAFSQEEEGVSQQDIKTSFERKLIDDEFEVLEIPVKEILVSQQATKAALNIFGDDLGHDIGGMMRLLCRGTMGAIKRGMVIDLPNQFSKVAVPLSFDGYGDGWAVVHLDPIKHKKAKDRYVMITCLEENHRSVRDACISAGIPEGITGLIGYVLDGEDEA